ncbi:pilus assembly protein PilM [Geomonas sp. Red32]|uniref:type IV pilus biogenesis protein PilM n=1 Tax=Geomonas sp. Red32 TaxID=2912856 RepID=UPI00202CBDF6|nr:pilus assembly protein PilM [Geomonas sp. Red32]MCM0082020.1 pilus assembly protein PilM [Geomonas sp. Red32]
MILSRKGLGLEVSAEGLSLAVASGGKNLTVQGGLSVPLPPGTLQLSRREPNVLNAAHFVAAVREAHLRLLTKERAASVSLPDAVGRVVLLDLEARFRSREEGLEIIRWKLKKNFPIDLGAVQLDYQTLVERENGAVSLLVSLLSRPVAAQYEELLGEAGLEPRFIDFTSFNLYRMFAQRLEMSEDAAFVSFYRGALTVLIFFGGVLSFYRTKETPGEAQNLYRELNSSLLVYRDRYPGQAIGEVFCMASPAEAEPFRALVAETTQMEPVLLDLERAVALGAGTVMDKNALHGLCAALGAASRSL